MKSEINTATAETVQTGGDQAVVQERLVRHRYVARSGRKLRVGSKATFWRGKTCWEGRIISLSNNPLVEINDDITMICDIREIL